MIVCDTGPLVAAALSNDKDHHACVELFTGLHLAGRDLLVPGQVVAEVGYLLAREAGARVESQFLRSLAEGDFRPVELTRARASAGSSCETSFVPPPRLAAGCTPEQLRLVPRLSE